MTMLELAAAVVVVSIIAIGMTSGAQAVMLHYQSDTTQKLSLWLRFFSHAKGHWNND